LNKTPLFGRCGLMLTLVLLRDRDALEAETAQQNLERPTQRARRVDTRLGPQRQSKDRTIGAGVIVPGGGFRYNVHLGGLPLMPRERY